MVNNTGVMLSTIRGLRRISQKELARISGVPHPYISRFENGKQVLDEAQLRKLEASLGISFDAIRPEFEEFAAVADPAPVLA